MAKPPRNPRPLGPKSLEELALAYVARFATSAGKLEGYLRRKLRERGWEGEDEVGGEVGSGREPPVAALIARFIAAGYLDDEAFARMRTGSLLRRGFGARRIAQALGADGIDEQVRAVTRAGPGEQRRAALALAQKRRFGPFGAELPDRPQREKQLAAMLRAGHPLDSARELVNAADIETALAWADVQDEDE